MSNETATASFHEYQWDFNNTIQIGYFGKVFVGVNTLDDSPVAVRNLNQQKINKKHENELEILIGICHENVIKVFDYGWLNELIPREFILVIELCNGGTLREILQSKTVSNGLNDEDFVSLVQCLSRAFTFLWNNEILQCNIQPDSICCHYENDGKAIFKVIGLNSWEDNSFSETIYYRHPTVNAKRLLAEGFIPLTKYKRIDNEDEFDALWSIGVTLYEATTGVKPFQTIKCETNAQLMKRLDLMYSHKKFGCLGMKEVNEKEVKEYFSLKSSIEWQPLLTRLLMPLLSGILEVDTSVAWNKSKFSEYNVLITDIYQTISQQSKEISKMKQMEADLYEIKKTLSESINIQSGRKQTNIQGAEEMNQQVVLSLKNGQMELKEHLSQQNIEISIIQSELKGCQLNFLKLETTLNNQKKMIRDEMTSTTVALMTQINSIKTQVLEEIQLLRKELDFMNNSINELTHTQQQHNKCLSAELPAVNAKIQKNQGQLQRQMTLLQAKMNSTEDINRRKSSSVTFEDQIPPQRMILFSKKPNEIMNEVQKNYKWFGLSPLLSDEYGFYPTIDWRTLGGTQNWLDEWTKVLNKAQDGYLFMPPFILPIELGGWIILLYIEWKDEVRVYGYINPSHKHNNNAPRQLQLLLNVTLTMEDYPTLQFEKLINFSKSPEVVWSISENPDIKWPLPVAVIQVKK